MTKNMKGYKLTNNPISWIIIAGMVGFMLAILILGGKNLKDGKVRYRSIDLAGKEKAVQTILGNRVRLLRDTIVHLTDTVKFAKQLAAAKKSLAITERELIQFNSGNIDTSITYFTTLLTVNRDTLYKALTDSGWMVTPDSSRPVIFHAIDTTSSLYNTAADSEVSLNLERKRSAQLMDFFSNNSMAGFWFIFSVAQMTLWFLVIALMIAAFLKLSEIAQPEIKKVLSLPSWLACCILPTLFFIIFGLVFYFFLVDTTVVKDYFFLERFNAKMVFYAVFGYLATIACFGMYLLTSLALDKVNIEAKKDATVLAKDTELVKNFQLIKRTFDNSFLATAIILSAFVLWTGIMFQTINQTEAMRFYRVYSGKDFLSYDYVYLVGAIHTIILLLFYVPVRMKFNSMEILGDQPNAPGNQAGNKILGNLYSSIGTVLVTASPLIVSLIQKLFIGLNGN